MKLDINALVADGKLDPKEICDIYAEVMEDGEISREEMDMLFELNDKAGTAPETHKAWKPVFVNCVRTHVLGDDGRLSDEEATYLVDRMGADGQIDENELAALTVVFYEASEVPGFFEEFCAANGVE